MAAKGKVDRFAYSQISDGLLFCGSIVVSPQLARNLPFDRFVVDVGDQEDERNLPALVTLFEREDLGDGGTGILALVVGSSAIPDDLRTIRPHFGRNVFTMVTGAATERMQESDIIPLCRTLVASSFAGHKPGLTAILRNEGFAGVDTLHTLNEIVKIGVDELIVCRPTGAVIMGWMLATPCVIASMHLCTPDRAFPINPNTLLLTERLDVLERVGRDHGFGDSRCGFMAMVPEMAPSNQPAWLRVQTTDGRVAYTTIPPRRLRHMPAIRRMMDVLDVHGEEIPFAFDTIIGPACGRLNAERLAVSPRIAVVRYGDVPSSPKVSLVIPLFGRVDYLEHQIAGFSFAAAALEWEIIYVLDDPPRRTELLPLAESVYARFGIPFTLLLLGENVGYAPASNHGLHAARGEYVCFLNSDVFPLTPDFLGPLTAQLRANPDIGAVGALLLYEDGSVQHEGMVMQSMPGGGGLGFPLHPRKGWRPRSGVGLERCEMITGACMVMRRDLAAEMGGFDEGFIVGDFEDADLCSRLKARGLDVAVDHDVHLYHLERKSQVSPDRRWRSNLTVYNAWLYHQRHRVKTAA